MRCDIAVVGMACRYPGAGDTDAFWENVLAQRASFRRIPEERLRLEDYLTTTVDDPDSLYSSQAAVLSGYDFDRAKFKVAGSTFRQTDMTHWLALDVAARALEDAGYPDGHGLPRDASGVIVGNTLTGEFSRARVLRLRWPYVRRVLESFMQDEKWSPADGGQLLGEIEAKYKSPFPPPNEDSLAGGLSNTIAGRICNHFDLHGGGYTIDGACASSLLAISQACSSLVAGDLELAVAGGVDLSLDPFELVGFARNGALARERMRVFDQRSNGFWPGEGCGFVVLMRESDAVERGHRIHARVRGWGISSDGAGGITRPTVRGQRLAFSRAYDRAGFGIESIGYFEGHGTGTAVGDATELETLTSALSEVRDRPPTVPVVGSVKALIGHTKAAAGVAGFIKAVQIVARKILPPTAGCDEPHLVIAQQSRLRTTNAAEAWPCDRPVRAGVSGMGFGGINAHLVLEGERDRSLANVAFSLAERRAMTSYQDAELFFFAATDPTDLIEQIERLAKIAPLMSYAQLADFAAHLGATMRAGRFRAAVVASSPSELSSRLTSLCDQLETHDWNDPILHAGTFAARTSGAPRIGFLFPGQGSPANFTGGLHRRRFEAARAVYAEAALPIGADGVETVNAQPAIVTASAAGLAILNTLGIRADVAVGHSLGELAALHWAGAIDGSASLELARTRGKAMSSLGGPDGAMATIVAAPEVVEGLIEEQDVEIACFNGPELTVVSGPKCSVARVLQESRARGIQGRNLQVSHAFHSSMVAPAVEPVAEWLRTAELQPLERRIVSTITGEEIRSDDDIRSLLCKQITEPVRFAEAISQMSDDLSLLIEVGPGTNLSQLSRKNVDVPVVSLDVGSESLVGLLKAVAAAFVLGCPVEVETLFGDRLTRPVTLEWSLRPLTNPCEQVPTYERLGGESRGSSTSTNRPPGVTEESAEPFAAIGSSLDLLRALIAKRVELPESSIQHSSRMLSDLHLNSIMVSELIADAARGLGVRGPAAPTEFANASVSEIATVLESCDSAASQSEGGPARGVEDWIRAFRIEYRSQEVRSTKRMPARSPGSWQVVGPDKDPLTERLRSAFRTEDGVGWIVRVPANPVKADLLRMLSAMKTALSDGQDATFVLVHTGGGAVGLAKTLHLEASNLRTCVVDVHESAELWPSIAEIRAQVFACAGFTEVRLREGTAEVPILTPVDLEEDRTDVPLSEGDVVVVTGGGKGITAECALALVRMSGVRLAILGRADPAEDVELARNLERLRSAGGVQYFTADVTKMGDLRQAVAQIGRDLGPIRGLLHGAGRNVPKLIKDLDEGAISRTVAVKVDALNLLLELLNKDELKLLVSFGSIIGRSGMEGEADYAVANEQLTLATQRFNRANPHCRCVSIEWSAWGGAGMAERLGTIDRLMRSGVVPISIEKGVAIFCQILRQCTLDDALVVTGRYGELPTLRIGDGRDALPWLRFVESVKTHTPGVELVVDAEISSNTDPYLEDHVFRGQVILPGVMAFEAMAQAATALRGKAELRPVLEDVVFERPIVVPEGRSVTLRTAVLADDDRHFRASVRAEDSNFQIDCVKARLIWSAPPEAPPWTFEAPTGPGCSGEAIYGSVLFHEGRFRRISVYEATAPDGCMAVTNESSESEWFAQQYPSDSVLGDASLHDTAIHAHQACVPHRPLLPQSVRRITWFGESDGAPVTIQTREIARDDNGVLVDVNVMNAAARTLQLWEGLRLNTVSGASYEGPWQAPLLGNFLSHAAQRTLGAKNLRVGAIEDSLRNTTQRRDALVANLAPNIRLRKRPDGKPEFAIGGHLSVSHKDGWTLVATADVAVGCDIEAVTTRDAGTWKRMLGSEYTVLAATIASEVNLTLDAASTIVWSCHEALRKAGAGIKPSLSWNGETASGWILFDAGGFRVAANQSRLVGGIEPTSIAIAIEKEGRSSDADR